MIKCRGCGVILQDVKSDELGYTNDLGNKLCERCFKLRNYGVCKEVSLTNDDYEGILRGIPKKALVVYVVDLIAVNFSEIPFYDNCILVLTKRDVLPKSVKEEKIIEKVRRKYSRFLEVIIISSVKNYHLDSLYQVLVKFVRGKDVYFVGKTNSGKSTLINSLLRRYGSVEDMGITTSPYPATTLDKIRLSLNELVIIDTPGLINKGSLENYLSAKELKEVTFKKEIKPKTCQVKGSGALRIASYARIDYQVKGATSFVIYTSLTPLIQFIAKDNPFLEDIASETYYLQENQDLVIPGLGFIKGTKPITIKIRIPYPVVPFVRENLI